MLVPIVVMSLISLDSRIDTMVEDMSHSTDFMIEQIFEQVRLALEQGNGNVAAVKGSEPMTESRPKPTRSDAVPGAWTIHRKTG